MGIQVAGGPDSLGASGAAGQGATAGGVAGGEATVAWLQFIVVGGLGALVCGGDSDRLGVIFAKLVGSG